MSSIKSKSILLLSCFLLNGCESFAGTRDLKVAAHTATDKPAESVKRWKKAGLKHTGNLLNQRITNLKGRINPGTGEVEIDFDYPKLEWALGPTAFPFQIRFGDKNGSVITTVTSQDFVPEEVFYRTQPGTYGRAFLDDRPDFRQERATFIRAKNNQLKFTINQRDAQYIYTAEVGFVTTQKTRTHEPMREFMPENIFIKDWSKEKRYEK
jgi:hypothetical protein